MTDPQRNKGAFARPMQRIAQQPAQPAPPARGRMLAAAALAGAAHVVGLTALGWAMDAARPPAPAGPVSITVIVAEPPPPPPPPPPRQPLALIDGAQAPAPDAPPDAPDAPASEPRSAPAPPPLSALPALPPPSLEPSDFAFERFGADILAADAPPRSAEEAAAAVAGSRARVRSTLAGIMDCRGEDGRIRRECLSLTGVSLSSNALVETAAVDPRFAFGPEFAGMDLSSVVSALGGGPLMPDAPDSPLAAGRDARLSSIDEIRDRLPASHPDPAFGD